MKQARNPKQPKNQLQNQPAKQTTCYYLLNASSMFLLFHAFIYEFKINVFDDK